MPDAVPGDPGFPAARVRMWTEVLTSGRYRRNRVAVAGRDGELAGIAMSGPPGDAAAAWTRQLYVLYVDAAGHGTGAGRALLEAVIDPAERRRCGSPIPTPARRRFTASTPSLPTGRPGPGTGYGRSAWSAACSTTRPTAPTVCNPCVAAPAGIPLGALIWPLRERGQIKRASRLSDSGGPIQAVMAGPAEGVLTRAPAAEIPVPVMPLERAGLPSSPGQPRPAGRHRATPAISNRRSGWTSGQWCFTGLVVQIWLICGRALVDG